MELKNLLLALPLLGAVASTSVPLDKAIVEFIRPILKSENVPMRVNYQGVCPGSHYLGLPSVVVDTPSATSTGITTIRQVLRRNPQVSVMPIKSGILTITVGNVSSAILETKLPLLALSTGDQYNPSSAVAAIAITADKAARGGNLPFSMARTSIDILQGGATKGAPHLPSLMKDVTVSDALDSVARQFHGVVLFGTCEEHGGESLFKVEYIYPS